jgi:hypothetical protein
MLTSSMSLTQPPVQLAGNLQSTIEIIPITEAYVWRMTIDG